MNDDEIQIDDHTMQQLQDHGLVLVLDNKDKSFCLSVKGTKLAWQLLLTEFQKQQSN
jgi:hypothetical protein